MSKRFEPVVVSANDLFDGRVIYLAADGSWVDFIDQSELIDTPERAEERLALANSQQSRLVGAYLAPAKAGENGPQPAHFREAFRATGPSNYLHGKQTEAR